MDMYIGLTDYDWYTYLRHSGADEVNFWKPGTQPFRALAPNGLFLFKLKKPYYAIVGGGFFVSYSLLPIDLAWEMFGVKNGIPNKLEFVTRIMNYKERNHMDMGLQSVGCIVLTEPFFFDEKDWIKPTNDWSNSIVTGKKYDISCGEGKRVYDEVMMRLSGMQLQNNGNLVRENSRYTLVTQKHRIGQGGFRLLVTNAYDRRCAISGEKTLPVLEAAHIKAFSDNGPNIVNNGILLRSDIHTLYDQGYITISSDLHIEVSHRLHEDFGNGKMYYQYHGQKLLVTPHDMAALPAKEFLEWHNDNIYLG